MASEICAHGTVLPKSIANQPRRYSFAIWHLFVSSVPGGCCGAAHAVLNVVTMSTAKTKVVIHSHATSKSSVPELTFSLNVSWKGRIIASISTKNITKKSQESLPTQSGFTNPSTNICTSGFLNDSSRDLRMFRRFSEDEPSTRSDTWRPTFSSLITAITGMGIEGMLPPFCTNAMFPLGQAGRASVSDSGLLSCGLLGIGTSKPLRLHDSTSSLHRPPSLWLLSAMRWSKPICSSMMWENSCTHADM
mmetsp:Transcript_48671/g.114220  ORF Transcript_48671/g.114220 Transcript_48671/m.114220 type:complete len:248 (-) Transcript_48671:15-758(-)